MQGPNWIVDAASESGVIHHDKMPERTNANGSKSWDVVKGTLATGETFNIHASMQPAGLAPNPMHPIQHTEFICVREGVLEIRHDGKVELAKPGDIILVAKGTVHQVRNAGDVPVKYTVVAIGGDAYKPAAGGKA